ncbi:restriction endonuclease subunit S [Halorussus limi]|uniref:Restriction endonuclease subunit S n=1 Tax=Halorussus limi TaxID=2938695 RepID=A0A8U0I076_9EURY|nr:restriction endonuclease subunit S [Halorussus limi]UPV76204.1 restriction endonuclease subunit S [Halorussus limi]
MSKGEYKDVQIGPKTTSIPESWEVKPLEEIFDLYAGGDIEDSQYSETKDEAHPYPIYANSTEDSGLYGYCSDFQYPEGSVTITGRGDLGHAVYRNNKFNAAVRLVVLSPSEDLDGRFFAYYINGNVYFPPESTGVPQLTRPQVAKTKVCFPPLPEQRRIADILSTVDEQIQQTDKIIKETKELKRGLIQDIFDLETTGESSRNTSGISLEEVPEKSLSNHVSVISGVHVKSDKVSDDSTKTPYLTGPDDFDEFGFSVTKFTDDPPKFCEPGDTLVTVKGSGCGKTTFANKRASISRQLKALRADGSLEDYYLYYWMQTKQELLSILAQGTSIPGLSTSDLTTLRIPVPSMETQAQIGNLLSNVDEKIRQETRHKEGLQELKHGLMQDLLTGKVRVNID